MDSFFLDWLGIGKLISKLKISSSYRPDPITSKMLKCTELLSSVILSRVFDQSLQLASLPKDWKVGKVVPVRKSGDIHSSNNY